MSRANEALARVEKVKEKHEVPEGLHESSPRQGESAVERVNR